jgi:seryl-tRNA synthetase
MGSMNDLFERGDDSAAHSLFHRMGSDGIYARTALFEQVIGGLSGFISRQREADVEVLRFPPVMSLQQIEKSGYLHSFPHFLGIVSCLHGAESKIRSIVDQSKTSGDWTSALAASDLVLTPAACYPLYPLVAARGPVRAEGYLFDVVCDCFRREVSQDVDRLQSFRMREFVCVGSAKQVVDFRSRWIARSKDLAQALGLPHRIEQASDAFFGRAGKLMAVNQIEQSLKFEWLIPVRSETAPTACMSFNYHQDHFGTTWNLRRDDGEVAHTGCVAFGLDRLALALFATHGLDFGRWPGLVRKNLMI